MCVCVLSKKRCLVYGSVYMSKKRCLVYDTCVYVCCQRNAVSFMMVVCMYVVKETLSRLWKCVYSMSKKRCLVYGTCVYVCCHKNAVSFMEVCKTFSIKKKIHLWKKYKFLLKKWFTTIFFLKSSIIKHLLCFILVFYWYRLNVKIMSR